MILLIYEYGIAVESNSVQKIKSNHTNDIPIADRLDRNLYGFDQDYFERMPLLVNAMQENSYIDPSVDTSLDKNRARYLLPNYTRPTRHDHSKLMSTTVDHRIPAIRRTSPRPFYFEYRSPTPTPFSKTYGSRSWIEGYRNAQRLRNLQQVIKYLEKTINAKFGDLYSLPKSTHIEFSGVYVEPASKEENKNLKTTPPIDLDVEDSKKVESRINHQPDPLYIFKPETPGDVNLLADGFFRFSPIAAHNILKARESVNIPMFRPITLRKRNYVSKNIKNEENKVVNLLGSGEIRHPEATPSTKPKSFSVLLNLFPLQSTNADFKKLEVTETSPPALDKIYITTSRPLVQFRRRSTTPIRRTTTRIKRPRILLSKGLYSTHISSEEKPIEPKMIVHVNVYPPAETKIPAESTTENDIYSTPLQPHRFGTEIPILTSTQVEDFHVGSSGIIPVEARVTPAPPPPISTLPTVTTMIPFFETPSSSTESSITTNQPEVIKFSQEDAKVPEQYLRLAEWASTTPSMIRRNSHDIEIKKENWDKETSEQDFENEETKTLIKKLKKDIETTIDESTTVKSEQIKETTTFRTYVPQINGHYRSVNQNSKNVNSWLNENTQSNRKRRLEISVTGFRKPTYVPQYVEIKRNNTKKVSDESDDELDSVEEN